MRRLEALLDAGVVPEEFAPTAAGKLTLAELNRAYQVALHVPDEDRALLNVIHARLGKTLLLTLDYKWVERWVSDMKREQNLAPSTIRHYVGALSRCPACHGRRFLYPDSNTRAAMRTDLCPACSESGRAKVDHPARARALGVALDVYRKRWEKVFHDMLEILDCLDAETAVTVRFQCRR